MQRKRGLELGRPFGFPLLVHRSWFGAGALLTVHLALTSFGADSLVVSLSVGAATTLAIFACVVLHEGAHALVRKWTGDETVDSVLFVFGGVTRTVRERDRGDAFIVLAGPLTNMLLSAGLFYLRSFTIGRLDEVLWTIGVANIVLAAVNLLPALPLDGGQLIRSLLRRRGRGRSEAVRAAARGGEAIGAAMIVSGGWLTLTSISTLPDAALGLWLAVVGGFLLSEASRSRRAARVVEAVAEGTAGAWARPFVGRVRSEMPVPEGGPYAVSDGARLAGILMPHERDGTQIAADVMIPWTPDIALPSDAPISRVLEQLSTTGSRVLVVLDDAGVVRGVIDSDGVQTRLGAL
ncbi:MAG TPA: site-2 protease family protein [Actinomycetota bacterium]|jgi:Zn-dependent protease|nr:site-2 protease family protein [Actinomycetota bacterium]